LPGDETLVASNSADRKEVQLNTLFNAH